MFDHLRTVSKLHDYFAENVYRWSHEWEMEQITFGGSNSSTQEYWQHFGITNCDYPQYFEVLYCGYWLYSQVLRGSILRVLPVLWVLYCSFTLPVLHVVLYSQC